MTDEASRCPGREGPPPKTGPVVGLSLCRTCGAWTVSGSGESSGWDGAFVPGDRERAPLPPPMSAALANTATLSPRERAAFRLLGLGYDNRAIARELQVSERTVKRHVSSILAKLGLESRLQAGLVALLAGVGAMPA